MGVPPLNSAAAALFVELRRAGYGAACASCERLHEASARGAPTCGAPSACGSVLSGNTFVHYRGPLRLDAVCVICGGGIAATARALVGGSDQGFCAAHLRALEGRTDVLVRAPQGIVLAADLVRPKRSLVRELLEEVESYYAKKDAEHGVVDSGSTR